MSLSDRFDEPFHPVEAPATVPHPSCGVCGKTTNPGTLHRHGVAAE